MRVTASLRREHRREWVLDALLWAFLSCFVLMKESPYEGEPWPLVVGGVLSLGAGVLLCRKWPLVSLTVAVVWSASRSPELFSPTYTAAMCLFAFLVGRRAARVWPTVLVFAGYALAGLVWSTSFDDTLWVWFAQLTTLVLQAVIPWLIGRFVRQYAGMVANGWELADRMEREQRAVADRERLRERSRIAGDMHDSLGHELSLIAVRAAALQVSPGLPAAERAAAGELRQAAADATARLRDIIGVLRTDEEHAPTTPADETVAALVERAGRSGLKAELVGEEQLRGLAPMADRAAHRVVQEALTNAAKHAPGAPVRVTVAPDGDGRGPAGAGGDAGRAAGGIRVEVVNPRAGEAASAGPGGPGGTARGGTGLVGLDERVRLAGGTLSHGPTGDGGFRVRATLPRAGGPVPPVPDRSATAARELSAARRRVRRGLVQAVVAPAAVFAVLGVLMLVFQQYSQSRAVLDGDLFKEVQVGDRRAVLDHRLPDHPLDGPPAGVGPEPAGADDCVYYRYDRYEPLPVYRLCFTGQVLSAKALVDDVPNEENRPRP
ncbi:sensor histidine kinase [Streptomyces sp. NPDC004111]|uniref:sensor histidine kinase n=1 Tax=Streptomyces sp. NPDC004111 TaxID=3364690 RepID=UPI0036B27B0E